MLDVDVDIGNIKISNIEWYEGYKYLLGLSIGVIIGYIEIYIRYKIEEKYF